MKQLLFLLCISSTLTACVSTPNGSSTPSKTIYRTDVTLGNCQSDPQESAVTTALFSSLIATGVDRISEMIKKASEKETLQQLASRNIEVSNTGMGPCLIIVRGKFHREKPSSLDFDKHYTVTNPNFKFNKNTAITHLRDRGLNLASTPDFYFEGRFEAAKNESENYVVVAPVYAYLGRPIQGAKLSSKGSRNVMLSFAVNQGGSQSDFSKGAGASLVLGKMKVGEGVSYPKDTSSNTVELKEPGNGKVNLVVRNSLESNWFSLPLTKDLAAMNLQVLVSETRDENKFLKFVSDVLGGATDEIKSELQNTLISSKKSEVEDSASAAYDAAYVAAVKAVDACANLAAPDPEIALKAKSALLALIKAKKSTSDDVIQDTDEVENSDVIKISIGANINAKQSCADVQSKL